MLLRARTRPPCETPVAKGLAVVSGRLPDRAGLVPPRHASDQEVRAPPTSPLRWSRDARRHRTPDCRAHSGRRGARTAAPSPRRYLHPRYQWHSGSGAPVQRREQPVKDAAPQAHGRRHDGC